MKLNVACEKECHYVYYGVKEISFPLSLLDSSHIESQGNWTWKEYLYALNQSSRVYIASWLTIVGPDFEPNDYRQAMVAELRVHRENAASAKKEESTLLGPGLSTISHADSEVPNIRNLVWIGAYEVKASSLDHLLQICARSTLIVEGRSCHGIAVQAGLQANTLTSNILINMYSKFGDIDSARQVFDGMATKSIVSWNTIMGAHSQDGEYGVALKLFLQMHREGTSFSEFTLSIVISACAAKLAIVECIQLHALAVKTAGEFNVFVGTALLDAYAKCKMIKDACLVFGNMPEKSSVTWSSMVSGFVQNDLYEEALVLFHRAQRIGLEHTQFTLSAALSACACLAANIEGTQLHAILVRTGFDSHLFVATSLLDVYSRGGHVKEAYAVFSSVQKKNIVVWNAMIAGFSRHARTIEALMLFQKMQQIGMYPNEVTYLSVLSACSHVGSVELGQQLFQLLKRDENVVANVLHYSCMVDVLGRAGLISEAWDLIQSMPFEPTASMWGSLLGSCRIHGEVALAKLAAERLFEIEPGNAGNHVLLSNIYAAKKKWGEVAMARKVLKDSGVKKEMGKSWIQMKGKVHTFVVGEGSHSRIFEVHAKLKDLEIEMKKFAYEVENEHDLHDVSREQKEELLRHHSEKLALAFGLVSSPPGVPIRIYKNLRICGDCHSFMKLASRITDREIVVRDTNRFHHFGGGFCSCRDFW